MMTCSLRSATEYTVHMFSSKHHVPMLWKMAISRQGQHRKVSHAEKVPVWIKGVVCVLHHRQSQGVGLFNAAGVIQCSGTFQGKPAA